MQDFNSQPQTAIQPEVAQAPTYQFNPQTKLKRSTKKKLRSQQFRNVIMSYQGQKASIENLDVFMENTELVKEQLIPLYYSGNLPENWIEDDELVEQLYAPIAELDPLGTKKFQENKIQS